MKPLPLPVRVAAGLAAAAVEQARKLPSSLAGLPVTVASTAMQLSMRAQQHVTELAIKGDEILATLRPAEETPEWATFDEDLDDTPPPAAPPKADDAEQLPGRQKAGEVTVTAAEEPPAAAQAPEPSGNEPAGVPGYDALSLAQVRARLRWLTVEQLDDLLAYEQATRAREEFVRMLTRRIATVRES
ncbi:lipid droplet-associated protein [Crossiella sp. CA-258035]|uniref:lipid droplet-associated protein n=1 Tax=Crossiella sp. CA-258035 TaxID=2981138 RepID=UPI0024BBFC74|nr:lipid droplet-associated protein [Crossiella sp. CA-258035]WHT18646.1 lipid droplet-associated protein [Crossiella sp. CA-258035]